MASKQPFINDSGNRQNITFPASSIELSDGTTAQAAVESLNSFKNSVENNYRKANTAYAKDSMSYAAELPAGFYLECTTNGTTSTGALVLPATIADGTTFTDGTVSWTIRKAKTLTRDSVIDALGYTPSNSGLSKAEVEQMIVNNNSGDISVEQLPFHYIVDSHTPPNTSYNGIFTWATRADSSGRIKMERGDSVGYNTNTYLNALTGQTQPNKYVICGMTINSNSPGIGFSLGADSTGVWVKFKGSSNSYQSTSSTSKDSASSWNLLCDRYGILGQASSIAFLNYYNAPDNLSNWKSWTNATLPFGLSTFLAFLDGKQYYWGISMKYGSDNIHAHKGYSQYETGYKNCGMWILLPYWSGVDGSQDVIMISFGQDCMANHYHMIGTISGSN